MHTKLEANYSCKCAQCTVNITSTATNDTVSWKLQIQMFLAASNLNFPTDRQEVQYEIDA